MWLRRERHCVLWGNHPNMHFFCYVFIPVTVGDLLKIPFLRVYDFGLKTDLFFFFPEEGKKKSQHHSK